MVAEFVAAIPGHSIKLLDKGFTSADLLLSLQSGAPHWHRLIPERKGLVLLLDYNLTRRKASQAAVVHQRAPSEISFKLACQFILWASSRIQFESNSNLISILPDGFIDVSGEHRQFTPESSSLFRTSSHFIYLNDVVLASGEFCQ